MPRPFPRPTTGDRSAGSACFPAVLAALFAVIFFGRAWLILGWGSPLPYYDQWSAEALGLYRPWLTGHFEWATLFAGHNEHRIVFTRVLDLLLLVSSEQWLTWWQLLINGALHAAVAVGLVLFLWKDFSEKVRPFFVLGCAGLFTSLPGWQNALWGFQSQFYFNHLFAVLGFGLIAWAPPFSPAWYAALACALLGLFTNGAGIIAAGAMFSLGLLKAFSAPEPASRRMWQSLPMLLLVVLGIVLRPEVAAHNALHASSITGFTRMFLHCLSWPWIDSDFAWIATQAPLILLSIQLWRRRRWPVGGELMIFGLGLFATTAAAAMALTRAGGLQQPLSRYQDTLMLGTVANLGAVLLLVKEGRKGRLAAILWSGILIAGLIQLSTTYLSFRLPLKKLQDRNGLAEAQAFYQTRNPDALGKDPYSTSLTLDPKSTMEVLGDPALRPILPREITTGQDDRPWLITHSPYLAAISVLFLVYFACMRQPPRNMASADFREP